MQRRIRFQITTGPGGWRTPAKGVGLKATDLPPGCGVEFLAIAPDDRRAGAVLASDAFFPFADGPQLALDAGITALIQPGGAKRDAEVTAAVDAAGAAMVHVGRRHFRH